MISKIKCTVGYYNNIIIDNGHARAWCTAGVYLYVYVILLNKCILTLLMCKENDTRF